LIGESKSYSLKVCEGLLFGNYIFQSDSILDDDWESIDITSQKLSEIHSQILVENHITKTFRKFTHKIFRNHPQKFITHTRQSQWGNAIPTLRKITAGTRCLLLYSVNGFPHKSNTKFGWGRISNFPGDVFSLIIEFEPSPVLLSFLKLNVFSIHWCARDLLLRNQLWVVTMRIHQDKVFTSPYKPQLGALWNL
jgi:hypothetical protein